MRLLAADGSPGQTGTIIWTCTVPEIPACSPGSCRRETMTGGTNPVFGVRAGNEAMADQRPRPQAAARGDWGIVVPLRARKPAISFQMLEVRGVSLLVVTVGGQVYLFPAELPAYAPDLLCSDPAGLAEAGAGMDVTAFFGPGRAASMAQAVAIYRASH